MKNLMGVGIFQDLFSKLLLDQNPNKKRIWRLPPLWATVSGTLVVVLIGIYLSYLPYLSQ